jgi:hypothetical protein
MEMESRRQEWKHLEDHLRFCGLGNVEDKLAELPIFSPNGLHKKNDYRSLGKV